MRTLLATIRILAVGLALTSLPMAGARALSITSDQPPVTSLADGRTGKIAFTALTPESTRSFISRQATKTSTIAGDLTLPPGAHGPVPAMVIVHGSGGVSQGSYRWAERMNALGVASFVIDNFTGRGVAETETDQSRLSRTADDAGALAALRLLATDPAIDAKRIGVMGFSRGGSVAIDTAFETVRRAVIDGDLRFAVHIPLYPGCSVPYIAAQTDQRPMLMLLGGKDDYTPAAACIDYAEELRKRGLPVTVVVYPNAYHAFDSAYRAKQYPLPVSARGCRGAVDLDTGAFSMRRGDTTVTGADAERVLKDCTARGVTMGGDPEAREKSPQDVAAFLKTPFALP
jgi:dienelactone hydrolase